jgi:hypothetical protein
MFSARLVRSALTNSTCWVSLSHEFQVNMNLRKMDSDAGRHGGVWARLPGLVRNALKRSVRVSVRSSVDPLLRSLSPPLLPSVRTTGKIREQPNGFSWENFRKICSATSYNISIGQVLGTTLHEHPRAFLRVSHRIFVGVKIVLN